MPPKRGIKKKDGNLKNVPVKNDIVKKDIIKKDMVKKDIIKKDAVKKEVVKSKGKSWSSIYIVADDRERKVTPHFTTTIIQPKSLKFKANVEVKIERITTGDFAIITKDDLKIRIIIERKSWTDLSNSMNGNASGNCRMDNHQKLLQLREATGCLIVYLIEGTKKINRGIPLRYMQSKLDHMVFRDGIQIVYTKNPIDSANRIMALAQNYLTFMLRKSEGSSIDGSNVSISDGQNMNNQKIENCVINTTDGENDVNIEEIQENNETDEIDDHDEDKITGQIKLDNQDGDDIDIDQFITDAIDNQNLHIQNKTGNRKRKAKDTDDIIKEEKVLNKIKINNHMENDTDNSVDNECIIPDELKIITKKTNDEIYISLFRNLPGVGPITGAYLAKELSFSKLVRGQYTKEQISNVKYGGKGTVGEKRAIEILKIANYGIRTAAIKTHAYIEFKKMEASILMAIPGISKQLAEFIIDKYSLYDLCSDKVKSDTIAKLTMPGRKRMIGSIIASRGF